MAKVNVYVPDEMLEWMRANDIKASAEFQARIQELRASRDLESEKKRIMKVKIKLGKVWTKPDGTIIGYVEDGGEKYVVYMV